MRDINAKLITILGDVYDLELTVNDEARDNTKVQLGQILAYMSATGALVPEGEIFLLYPHTKLCVSSLIRTDNRAKS